MLRMISTSNEQEAPINQTPPSQDGQVDDRTFPDGTHQRSHPSAGFSTHQVDPRKEEEMPEDRLEEDHLEEDHLEEETQEQEETSTIDLQINLSATLPWCSTVTEKRRNSSSHSGNSIVVSIIATML
jgi:hypothetical protein